MLLEIIDTAWPLCRHALEITRSSGSACKACRHGSAIIDGVFRSGPSRIGYQSCWRFVFAYFADKEAVPLEISGLTWWVMAVSVSFRAAHVPSTNSTVEPRDQNRPVLRTINQSTMSFSHELFCF